MRPRAGGQRQLTGFVAELENHVLAKVGEARSSPAGDGGREDVTFAALAAKSAPRATNAAARKR
jgi:hypothetical protein